MSSTSSRTAAFRRAVWAHYRARGRHALPWRKTRDPYRILVSEVMLQQTQVERVIPYYEAWMRKYPTARRLAAAPLSDALRAWQGLGYNRRAKLLHAAAKEIARAGRFPDTVEETQALPGVGPYTARAIAAFARNEDAVFVETNIRTAVVQNFFPGARKVDDAEVRAVLEEALPKGRAREWYSALMDYGAHLKRSGVRLNARGKGYKAQARFAGSLREARGAVLRELAKGSARSARLAGLLGPARRLQVKTALAGLAKEGLVARAGSGYRLPR